jgi:peptide/nickel transport system ATP-binding protein
MNATPFLSVDRLEVHFPVPTHFLARHRPVVHAINGVSIDIEKGEAFCLVGESGCGKTTLGRTIMGLTRPTRGEVRYEGRVISGLTDRALRPWRQRMQMIFQNPYASLNPRLTVQQTLEEPLRFHRPKLTRAEVREQTEAVMISVGNDPGWGSRYPHEFSGGQRQRISIARALMVDPEFIVADEPVSALDVSIQAQVLNLLMKVRRERRLTYLFITHNLSVVQHIGSRVAVMYLGTVCELSDPKRLFEAPRHPYTRLLLSAIPKLGSTAFEPVKVPGEVPSPIDLPSGCVFHGRCPYANERCRAEVPILKDSEGVQVACHAVEEGRI